MKHEKQTLFLPLSAIRSPQSYMDPAELRGLVISVVQYGILQPLSVRRDGRQYELLDGRRRLRAARLAGLGEVPCLIVEGPVEEPLLEWMEFFSRRDLDYIDEARGLRRFMEAGGFSQEQAAGRLGRSQSAVANKLRLLRHPPEVLEALRQTGLTERHARALLRVPVGGRMALIRRAAEEKWSVARLEAYLEQSPEEDAPMTRLLHAAVQAGGRCCRREEPEEIVLTIRLPREKSAGISCLQTTKSVV